jgi:hypothetical protein
MTALPFGDPLLAALARRLESVRRRARTVVFSLPPELMLRIPPGGGWSMGEVFEHLCIANGSYTLPVERAIAKSLTRSGAPRKHKSTFGGGFLIRALGPNGGKVPTLRAYMPLNPREDVFSAFLDSLDVIEALMHDADGHDLRVMLASPVMPLLRMNLGEAFEVAVVHAERHLVQIERTRKAIEAS